MRNLVRVAPGALIVGKPLPWTVYDEQGNLLLNQGYVIQNESQLEQLFERGLFYPRHGDEQEELAAGTDIDLAQERNPFTDYSGLVKALGRTFADISARESSSRLRLLGLARLIDRICRQAPDPCLALVHLYSVEPTAAEQALFYGILCHFTARQLGMDDKRILVLMAAAMTANLALLPVLDKLNTSSRTLTPRQRDIIHKHPLLSSRALRDAGIDNRLLLKIIEQHHERGDGRGYPAGLSLDILPEARILALAELYTALISRRGYRDRLSIADARKAVRDAGNDSDRPLLNRALLTAMTPYPPGSLVRLANGEVAVVTHRPGRYTGHTARAIIDPRGSPYQRAPERDCGLLEFNIRALEIMDILPSMDFSQLWGYT